MPISILMSKIIFKKYLPSVGSKLVPKLNWLIEVWHVRYFRYTDFEILISKKIFIKYLSAVGPDWPKD